MVKKVAFYAIHLMQYPDAWETPECAIQAFESLTQLTLVVHDLTEVLWPYLSPERFRHCSSCCLRVKATHDWACVDFEVTRLRKEILEYPDGRLQVCHAGMVEWVMPVVIDGQLAWVLFAGQARLSRPMLHAIQDIRSTVNQAGDDLQSVSEQRSFAILEAMRQLRTRLLDWHASMRPYGDRPASLNHKDQASRAHTIRSFITKRHAQETSVNELAKWLGLSESRTIHLVKELFGVGYSKLLNQERLKTASLLLRNSDLPVHEICYASGFRDLSNFHRTFLKHFKMTPTGYRKSAVT